MPCPSQIVQVFQKARKQKSAYDIFGDVDEMKLQSSMTLFALASDEDSIFHQVLDCFYDGEMDPITVEKVRWR